MGRNRDDHCPGGCPRIFRYICLVHFPSVQKKYSFSINIYIIVFHLPIIRKPWDPSFDPMLPSSTLTRRYLVEEGSTMNINPKATIRMVVWFILDWYLVFLYFIFDIPTLTTGFLLKRGPDIDDLPHPLLAIVYRDKVST